MSIKSEDDLYVEDPDESDFIVVQENVLDFEPPPEPEQTKDEDEVLGGFAPTFNPDEYESHEMKRLITMHAPDETLPLGFESVDYKSSDIFPDWILQNNLWKQAPKKAESNEISDILNIPVGKRSQEQVSKLIHWLMSVWQTANQMGFKRCGSMFKEFSYNIFQPNDNIITEGERGLTFYIIISGSTVVTKDGRGVVGHLGKGKSFGEVALTQGKDLRTATVTAQTRVEVLSLHKQNYDIFVRDILEMERRENFQLLTTCSLFKNWAKGKIDKMCNTCTRRNFEDGQYIFRQGDPPGDLMLVVEGGVTIFKELIIITKNRWPTGLRTWKERVKRTTKPIVLKTLLRGEYFGEIAILKNTPRSTSAIAQGRTVLLCVDKAEFLYLLNMSTLPIKSLKDEKAILTQNLSKYYDDMQVIDTVQHIKGGPSSVAYVGQLRINKSQIDDKVVKEYSRDSEDIDTLKPSSEPAGVSLDVDGDNKNASRPSTGGKKNVAISHPLQKRREREQKARSARSKSPSSRKNNNNNNNSSASNTLSGSKSSSFFETSNETEERRPGTTGSMVRSPKNAAMGNNRAANHGSRPSTSYGATPSRDAPFVAKTDPTYMTVTRRQSVAEQIRMAVMEAKIRKQRALENRNLDYSRQFEKHQHDKHTPHVERGVSVAATHLIHSQIALPIGGPSLPALNPAKAHLRLQSQQIIREKLDAHNSNRRGSISFQAGAVAPMPSLSAGGTMNPMSAAAAAAAAAVGLNFNININNNDDAYDGNNSCAPSAAPVSPSHRRVSLQGLDNDATTTYAFDSNKVVMRRNSVIRLGQVYEHVYQRIQLEAAAESAASAAAAAMFGQPIARNSTNDVFGMPPSRTASLSRGRSASPTAAVGKAQSLSRQASGLLRKSHGDMSTLLPSQSRGSSHNLLSRTNSSAQLRGNKGIRALQIHSGVRDSFDLFDDNHYSSNNNVNSNNIYRTSKNSNIFAESSIEDDSSGGGGIVGRVPFA